MKKELFILLIALLAGLPDGAMDKVQFHYGKSIFAKLPAEKQTYFNPQISWELKYKDVEAGDYRPRFPLSTTALVSLTDFWHLMKQTKEILLFLAMGVAAWIRPRWHWIAFAYLAYKVGFYLMYNWLLVA